MTDLIDRAVILRKNCHAPARGNCNKCDWNGDSHCSCEIFGVQLANAPAVDAVPVVRCKECIGRTTWIKSADFAANICGMSGMFPRGETDFCSYGERRTDGSTD
jgi:hypothetical protein